MMKRILTAASFALALSTTALQAGEVKIGDIVVKDAWTRATPPGSNVAGGFMSITNTGKAPDRLVGGTTPVSKRMEVHEMTMDGGVMKMREVTGGLEIKPGETVELKPGGYHVMFIDIVTPPTEGSPVKGTLKFEKAGSGEITYDVAPVGAKSKDGAAGKMDMHGGHHGKH